MSFMEHAYRLRAEWVFYVCDIARCHVGTSVSKLVSMLMFQSIVYASANASPRKQQDS